jgi:spore coat protein CotH
MVLAVSLPPAGQAQTSEELFDSSRLHDIRLFLFPRDWSNLRDNYLTNTYYAAEMEWSGLRVENIAVRSRGLGSRNPFKPGLRVDFNRYSGQKFLGLKAIILDNAWQDPSFLRESAGMRLFRAMNLPAPRESFARLFVNNEYWGLYSVVEDIDEVFLDRTMGESKGWLYEFKWVSTYSFEDLGGDPGEYLALFSPQTRQDDPKPEVISEWIQFINHASEDDFNSRIGDYIDVTAYLRFVAVETFLAEWDGQLGDWGLNNFYLYRPSGSMRFHWIAWDKDVVMRDPVRPAFQNSELNILFRRLIEHRPFLEIFLSELEAVSLAAGGTGGLLDQGLEADYTLIRAAVQADTRRPESIDEFEAQYHDLRDFLASRGEFVYNEIQSVRDLLGR